MNYLAAFDLEALIPLFIAGFWIVAQILGAVNKKKSPPTKSRPAGGPAKSDPMSELMSKLNQIQDIKQPSAPATTKRVQPARPAQQLAARKPGSDTVSLSRTQQEPTPAIQQSVRRAAIAPQKPIALPDMDANPTMRSFKSSMPSMKLPTMNLRVQTSKNSRSGVPRIGKIIQRGDKQALRRAVIGQVVLGKPKAFQRMTDDG